MYSGVFRDRYIPWENGRWREGLILPRRWPLAQIVPSVPRNYVKYAISIDYGTLNPCGSMGLWGLCDGVWYRFKEFYHNGRELRRQLTDEEYYQELEKAGWGPEKLKWWLWTPARLLFIACIRKHGRFFVRHARNDVLDGIRKTAGAFQEGKVAVCDCCPARCRSFLPTAGMTRRTRTSQSRRTTMRWMKYVTLSIRS